MSARRVEEALAAWRTQLRHLERLDPNTNEYRDAERETFERRDEYQQVAESVGPGAESVAEAPRPREKQPD